MLRPIFLRKALHFLDVLFGLGLAPQEWVYEGSPFTFVTDAVESVVEQARAVAENKNVALGTASIVQLCIEAGLLDEIHIDLVPVLLGGGVPDVLLVQGSDAFFLNLLVTLVLRSAIACRRTDSASRAARLG